MGIRVLLLLFLLHVAQSKVLELTCSQIRAFVDGHNSRRLKLAKGEIPNQPAASEMKLMMVPWSSGQDLMMASWRNRENELQIWYIEIWDEELAAKAANWASHNKFMHNPDRTVASGRFGTGENIYLMGSTDKNWNLEMDSPMQAWFDEYKDFKYGPIQIDHFKDSNKPVGHYTQMAWWNSVYLGCGISEYFENGFKVNYVVCNYGPPGNYLGQVPYKADGASNTLTCSGDQCNHRYGSKC